MCSQSWNKSQKSHNTPRKQSQNHVAFHKVPKITTYSRHQYFEVMALALRTFKKWPFCLWGVFTQAWRNHLLQFSHKLQLTSVAIRIPNHISSMFLVLKLSQFVLGGSYFFCCVYNWRFIYQPTAIRKKNHNVFDMRQIMIGSFLKHKLLRQ